LECVFDFDDKAGDFKIEQQSSYLWTLFQVWKIDTVFSKFSTLKRKECVVWLLGQKKTFDVVFDPCYLRDT
jgi:hypothetical protein